MSAIEDEEPNVPPSNGGTDVIGWPTPWAKKPVALLDMGVFVFQVSVRPNQALGGEYHLVSGLLEFLQQLFRARGKNHIVAVKTKMLLHYGAS